MALLTVGDDLSKYRPVGPPQLYAKSVTKIVIKGLDTKKNEIKGNTNPSE